MTTTALKPIRQIESFQTREEAEHAMFAHAAKLVEKELVGRFSVFVRPIRAAGSRFPVGWAVCLKDRGVLQQAAG